MGKSIYYYFIKKIAKQFTTYQGKFKFALWLRVRLLARVLSAPHPIETLSRIARLSTSEINLLCGKWYHNFENLGFKTDQYDEHHRLNQLSKQYLMREFIILALQLCKSNPNMTTEGVELFCADSLYANMAIKLGATKMLGIDLNEKEILKARLITRILGNQQKVALEIKDVFHLEKSYDFGICAGGLYHLQNPEELLELLLLKIRTALVIQTVFSLARTEPDYFEAPAPGWSWGCRFSYDYLLSMVKQAGWEIVAARSNELEGNVRSEDRGSAYLLCVSTRSCNVW